MTKRTRLSCGFLVLVLVMLACASPLGGGQPSAPDQMATMVELTSFAQDMKWGP